LRNHRPIKRVFFTVMRSTTTALIRLCMVALVTSSDDIESTLLQLTKPYSSPLTVEPKVNLEASRISIHMKVTTGNAVTPFVLSADTLADAPPANRSASSTHHFINCQNGGLTSTGAWCPEHDNTEQYYDIDTGQQQDIGGIVTKGQGDADHWVKAYRVTIRSEGSDKWVSVDYTRDFQGNSDRTSLVTNRFTYIVQGRYVRIIPIGWHGHIALRAGVLVLPFIRDTPSGWRQGLLLLGGTDASPCGNLYTFLKGTEFGIGVQCNSGGSDVPLETSIRNFNPSVIGSGLGIGNATQYTVDYIYDRSVSPAMARIYIEGVLQMEAPKNFNFSESAGGSSLVFSWHCLA